jgi:hypothetical protein
MISIITGVKRRSTKIDVIKISSSNHLPFLLEIFIRLIMNTSRNQENREVAQYSDLAIPFFLSPMIFPISFGKTEKREKEML